MPLLSSSQPYELFPVRQARSRPGSVRVRPPGPDRQGTGLFFSTQNPTTSLQRSTSRMNQVEGPVQATEPRTKSRESLPLAQVDSRTSLVGDTPAYERGFGGFPSPVALAGRFANAVAPRHIAELKRKLTLDADHVYIPIKYAEGDRPNQNTSTGLSRTITGNSLHRRVAPVQEEEIQDTTLQIATTPRAPLAPPHMFTLPESGSISVPAHLRHPAPRPTSGTSSTATSQQGWIGDLNHGMMKTVRYIKEGVLRVGRNSAFNTDDLSDEQLADLGGMEFRALQALSWIVGIVRNSGSLLHALTNPACTQYFVGTQVICATVFMVYLYTTDKYDPVFAEQERVVSKAWLVGVILGV